jgi:hypothetical protein
MMLPHHPTGHALKRALEGTNGQTVSVFGKPSVVRLIYLFLTRCAATFVA